MREKKKQDKKEKEEKLLLDNHLTLTQDGEFYHCSLCCKQIVKNQKKHHIATVSHKKYLELSKQDQDFNKSDYQEKQLHGNYTCDVCGGQYTYKNKSNHELTLNHQNAMWTNIVHNFDALCNP